MNKTVFYLSGLPALGKSTYTKDIQEAFPKIDFHVMSVDSEIEAIARDRGLTYDEVFDEVREDARTTAQNKLSYAFANGKHVIWDQVNINQHYRIKSLKEMPKGYSKHASVFLPPKNDDEFNLWMIRLNSRPGKTLPMDVLMTMADHYTLPTITDGFKTCMYIDSFSANYKEVFDIQDIFERLLYMKDRAQTILNEIKV